MEYKFPPFFNLPFSTLNKQNQRLSNFNSLLNDAVAQVKSAESVTLKWIPIEFLPSEHIKTELDQTKVS